jgi:hypothetical protein
MPYGKVVSMGSTLANVWRFFFTIEYFKSSTVLLPSTEIKNG